MAPSVSVFFVQEVRINISANIYFGIAISIAKSQSIAILIAKFSSITKSIAKYESIATSIAKNFKYCKKYCKI